MISRKKCNQYIFLQRFFNLTTEKTAMVINFGQRYLFIAGLKLCPKIVKEAIQLFGQPLLNIFVVVPPRFELRQTEPKSVVLPLHHGTKFGRKGIKKLNTTKRKREI